MTIFADILKAFGFIEMREMIGAACGSLFLLNFLGGMVAAIFFVNAKSLKKPKKSKRISFRLLILCEIMLAFGAVYYHLFAIQGVALSHVIFWGAAMVSLPLLAIIGAQVVYVAFSGKIEAKRTAFIAEAKKTRAKREEAAAAKNAKPAKS